MTARSVHRRSSGAPSAHGVDQRGSTLVEVLVALFLVTVLVMALIQGLLTSTTATATSNRAQRLDAALSSFGESIKQLTYVECADPDWYQHDFDTVSELDPQRYGIAGATEASIQSVEYWQSGSFRAGETPTAGSFGAACSAGGSQLVTYRVELSGRTESAQVVKRTGDAPFAGPVSPTTTTTIAPGNTAPVARFTSNPSTGDAPLTVAFDASGSTDDGVIDTYEWTFGDGATATGQTTSHQFSAGAYLVKLTVTDDDGARSSTYRTVAATGQPAAPTGLHKTGQSVDMSGVYFDLAWDAVPGVQEYELRLEGTDPLDLCGTRTVNISAPATAGRINASTLCSTGVFGIDYNASIRARAGTQWSAWSSPVEVSL